MDGWICEIVLPPMLDALQVHHHEVMPGLVVGPVGECVQGGGELVLVDVAKVAVVLVELSVLGEDLLHRVKHRAAITSSSLKKQNTLIYTVY